jgi:serine O-acetyltransferase
MFETVRDDLRRWVTPGQVAVEAPITLGTALKLLWRHRAARPVLVFRLACWFKQRRIPFFPNALQQFIMASYGLEIPSGGDIGGGLYVAHPVGAVVMPARIGRNCSIIASATIGMRNEWEFPTIGDNVFIGAGARVLGGIRVGNDAVIGANSVVIHDVPDGATVVGIPGRITRIYGKPVCESHS